MDNYETMYRKMFNAVTDAECRLRQITEALQKVQQECEEIFISAGETPNTKES